MESSKRSWAKAITWRAVGIIVLLLITWLLTESWEVTTSVTVLFHVVQVILFYLHERFWDRINWGLKNKDELTDKEKKRIMERLRRLGYID